ncbi:MAG: ABC transporter substrate-binding protein [Deltaproteobacteria bacterium]|jgi:iron complex transport system substrate-binding protein|nr:ABC transporter substrate-binding protein [Deltaproteobacteria bacterium]
MAPKLFAALALALAFLLAGPPWAQAAEKPGPKIISLYAADTEILLRLGARDSLVGVSRQETYSGPETDGWQRPPEFSIHDDVEKFLAAAPDYVLLRPMHRSASPALFETLEKAGIKLWARQCSEAKDLYDFWLELGALAGRETEAKAMIEAFKARIDTLTYRGPGPKPGVFLESIHKEVKTFTPDSIPAWLLTLAGGQNVATDSEPTRPGQVIANYGPERLLEKADRIDVFISQEGPMNKVDLATIKDRKIYSVLPAFKNGRVYRVPEELISRPSPSLAEGLALLKDMIHPPTAP